MLAIVPKVSYIGQVKPSYNLVWETFCECKVDYDKN